MITKEFTRQFWSALQHWRLVKFAEHMRDFFHWWK